ncbi:MAG TPA: elongation factor G, partial [Saprospirales bacterium]|nr:elongation factor G [Saprospirales bacterium]
NEDDMGMTYEEIPVPADLVDTVAEWREKLLEAVAEYDETLMEKYFEDPASITEQEMINAVRGAVLDNKFVPMMCGSA